MKTITRDYRMEGNLPSSYMRYFEGMRCCVLDIETSGLSRENSKVILIGLLTETDSGVKVTQFLAENHYEEHKVLQATLDFLRRENIGYLVTYNGASFDMPFIGKRLEAHFFEESINLYDLDLFRFIKCGTDLRQRLDSLSQKSVENYYGILGDRDDSITGRESVTMFDEYSLTGNSTLEKIILTHNREDVLHLYRLMHYVLSDIDRDDNMDMAIARYGFPIMYGRIAIRPSVCCKGRGSNKQYMLKINGDQIRDAFSAAFFPDMDSPVTAEFNSDTKILLIEIPVEKAPDELSDANNVCYLDVESLGIDLGGDSDCVNGYLILNPRTINLVAKEIVAGFVM